MAKNNQIALRNSSALVKRSDHEGTFVTPPADIYETSDAFIVKLDVPGAEKKSIQIAAEQRRLIVKCPVQRVHGEGGRMLFTELGQKSYYREFNLSNGIDVANITATLENAVVTITLPKLDSIRVKQIPIQ